MNVPLYPVILCGGSGTRLWPLSRGLYPKQFMDLGKGRTLFKDTLQRATGELKSCEPLVVCNEGHRFYTTEGLTELNLEGLLLLEPAPRNTAPAVDGRRGRRTAYSGHAFGSRDRGQQGFC